MDDELMGLIDESLSGNRDPLSIDDGLRPMVIYHDNCNDGFCAAWLLRSHIENPLFVPAKYGDPLPPNVEDRDVYVVDFSYPMDQMAVLVRLAQRLVMLDHHKTAAENLLPLDRWLPAKLRSWQRPPIVTIDQGYSGATLAWRHVIGGTSHKDVDWEVFGSSGDPHWLVRYVEDRDLWRFELPSSHEVNATISSYELAFDSWDRLSRMSVDHVAVVGSHILRYRRKTVDEHLKRAFSTIVAGYLVRVCNATTLFSEVATELSKDGPFGACYFDREDGLRQWSLRSTDDGPSSVDVSEVARKFGGGGHQHSAGFTTRTSDGFHGLDGYDHGE